MDRFASPWSQKFLKAGSALTAPSPSTNATAPLSINLTAPRFGHKVSLPYFPSTDSFNALTGSINKSNIGKHLKWAFEQLDDVPGYNSLSESAAYIDGMQTLLAAVVKSVKAFLPFLNDDQLFLEVSGYAIAKLPKEKQIEFNARYDRKSLLSLMGFLRKEILLYYENFTNHTAKAAKVKKRYASSGEEGGLDAEAYCVYCRNDGHTVHECSIKRNMLCFKCTEFGHTLKVCPNGRTVNM